MALAEQEVHHLQTWAPLLAWALVQVAEKHGIPSERDLSQFLASGSLGREARAAPIARSLIRFWTRDYEGAAFTAAPRIEALARDLVVALDAGVYRLQREQRPGQYPGLAALLTVLRKHEMDESWFRMVYTVCCNPAGGWNLRNEIGHGLVDGVAAPGAAVLLQALLYLAFLGPGEPAKSSGRDANAH